MDRAPQCKNALFCALLLTAGLMLPFFCHEAQAARNPNVTTVTFGDLAPAFTAPGRANVTILTFTISDSNNWEEFTRAVVNYTGNTTADIKVARLFRESGTSPGTFNSSTDTPMATNSSITSRQIALSFSYFIQRNRNFQFYVVFDIADNATHGNAVDAKINVDALTIQGLTWPDVIYDPAGASKIDAAPPSNWTDFWPGGWQNAANPDCRIAVGDNASGLAVGTAQYRYSTDGGGNWSAWTNASCTGVNGTNTTQNITTQKVPFGRDSGTDNLISFRIKDMMDGYGRRLQGGTPATKGPT